MAFPTSPTNGQQANINGITYTYSNTATAWTVSTSVSNTFVSINVSANVNSGNVLATGVISATGNVSGGNLVVTGNIVDTGALTIVTGSNGNITLSPNGTGIVAATGAISTTGNISANNATFTSNQTLSYGTANGVIYLNSNKVATSGSALVFDGTNLGIGTTSPSTGKFSDASCAVLVQSSDPAYGTNIFSSNSNNTKFVGFWSGHSGADSAVGVKSGTALTFGAWAAINGAGGFSEWGRFDSSGNLLVGATTAAGVLDVETAVGAEGVVYCIMRNNNGTKIKSLVVNSVSTESYNTAVAALWVGRATANGRSLNAGGTVNASGADYAEYMTKAGDFTIAKGDVVGIDSNGKLTNVFADAVSFMVKSTDPSYVGGDSWGSGEAIGLAMPEKPSQRQPTEEVEAETDEEFAVRQTQYENEKTTFNAALEAARQRVDRIAFAGQVPVNVIGATAGQYIIPVNDNGAIKGEAVSNPTFEQYQISVGKVIAIESDGRAKIIVKVA